jgi:hypothetical protein
MSARAQMMRFRILITVVLLCGSSFAKTRYVAQSAGTFSGGSACNGQATITPATWNSTAESAGDITYVCGTITAPAGASSLLAFGWSGSSSNPLELIFDTDAVITSTYWTGKVVDLGAHDYITVNGGKNGTISATANGTSLANHSSTTYGVYAEGGSDVTIENITISGLYTHVCADTYTSCTDTNGGSTFGIFVQGGSNVTVEKNTITDAFAGVQYSVPGSSAASNISVDRNTITNCNWGMYVADGNTNGTMNDVLLYGNNVNMTANWATSTDTFHSDGIFLSSSHSGSKTTGALIYNNTVVSTSTNGWIGTANLYLSADTNGGYGTIESPIIFNNVFYLDASAEGGNGPFFCWVSGCLVYNNTSYSTDTGHETFEVYGTGGTGATILNNIFQGTGNCADVVVTSGGAIVSSNYNDYYGCSSVGYLGSTYHTTLASWAAVTDGDANSTSANPLLNTSSTLPLQLSSTSSAAYRTGENLTSLCSGQANPGLGALCYDVTGTARPSTGAWDMGAYYYSGGSAPPPSAPAPPTALSAVVQ